MMMMMTMMMMRMTSSSSAAEREDWETVASEMDAHADHNDDDEDGVDAHDITPERDDAVLSFRQHQGN